MVGSILNYFFSWLNFRSSIANLNITEIYFDNNNEQEYILLALKIRKCRAGVLIFKRSSSNLECWTM